MIEEVVLISPEGEVREVEATPETLVPLMVRGWRQIDYAEEVTSDVGHADAGDSDLLRQAEAD